ncbi:MAG: BTAD domain-containing putative transcriptional regulator [Pseudomonadota bacterium]
MDKAKPASRTGQYARPLAKISRPRPGKIFSRLRLFELLDRLRESPVVWVTGPPGAGKTTLISDYLAARAPTSIWYQIDAADQDPATFFYYLGLAVKRASRRRRPRLPLLTPEYLLNIPGFARLYFRNLFIRLKNPAVLVFDNYQEISPDSSFQALMATALGEVPPGANVIILSRNEPPAPLACLQVNGALSVMGWDALRLDIEETQGVIDLYSDEIDAQGNPHQWLRRVQGWVAGLVLFIHCLESEDTEPEALAAFTPEVLSDYFRGEVIKRLDPELQDFLYRSALLPKMTGSMAQALTGNKQAGRILSDLVKRNYFTTRHIQGNIVYQYHPLFRDVLLDLAQEQLGEQACRVLKRRAAELLAASGRLEGSLDYLLALEEWAPAARVLTKLAPTLLIQGRHQRLLEWLARIPQDWFVSIPWLNYWRGMALLSLDLTASRRALEPAYDQFKAGGDVQGLYLCWSGIVDGYCIEGYFLPLGQWLEEFERIRELHPPPNSPRLQAGLSISVFGAMTFNRPDHPEFPLWEARLLQLLQGELPVEQHLMAAHYLMMHHAWYGGSREIANKVLDSVLPLQKARDSSPLTQILTQVIQASYDYWYSPDPEQFDNSIKIALRRAEASGVRVMDGRLHAASLWVTLTQDRRSAAQGLLQKMRTMLDWSSKHDVWIYHIFFAWERWLGGHFQQALDYARVAREEGAAMGGPPGEVFPSFALAQIHASQGDYLSAFNQLAMTRRKFQSMRSHNYVMMCWLAAGLYALKRGQPARCDAFLRRAFNIGRRKGYLRFPFFKRSDLTLLCARALEQEIEVEYARALIRAGRLDPVDSMLTNPHWPWPLKIRCFGEFEVIKNGQPLRFSRKAPKKPLELLSALIALGGKNIPETRLLDALWFDEEADAAHSAFTTNLYRLRKLVGEGVIKLRGGLVTLASHRCWVDVWAFDHLLKQANDERHQSRLKQWLSLTEKALLLYRGQFISGMTDAAWSLPARERQRHRFVTATVQLGHYLQQLHRWEAAIEVYHRGLQVDNLVEEFYQGLMQSYHHLGRPAEVIEVYRRCKRMLSIVLGTRPSRNTTVLYDSLSSG